MKTCNHSTKRIMICLLSIYFMSMLIMIWVFISSSPNEDKIYDLFIKQQRDSVDKTLYSVRTNNDFKIKQIIDQKHSRDTIYKTEIKKIQTIKTLYEKVYISDTANYNDDSIQMFFSDRYK